MIPFGNSRRKERNLATSSPRSANNPEGVDSDKSSTDAEPPRDREIKAAGFNGGLSINFVLGFFFFFPKDFIGIYLAPLKSLEFEIRDSRYAIGEILR